MENKVQIIQKDDEQAIILVAEFPGMVHYVVPEKLYVDPQVEQLDKFLNQPSIISFHINLPAKVAEAAATYIEKDILGFLRYPEMKVDNTDIPLIMTIIGQNGFFSTTGRITAAESGFLTFKSPEVKYILEEIPGIVEEAALAELDTIQKIQMLGDVGQWIPLTQ